ncbi:unnamed protein product [Soboliphyme baturini]|uniref:Structure-specific endonuclease subunit SLX1 homolog n=1 Tax=Soboliphyme baturini TaxID=241478 RepID=A0A183IKM1_9BILA|nr:unnamed protein product [Soboliphyme baturini]
MNETAEDVFAPFFGCYLLLSDSQNPKFKNRTYVGFTVNPSRRLKQHNRGIVAGGAWRTNDKGPWKMVLIVHGFPNRICALRFEWAWQHPKKSRRLRDLHLTQRCNETHLNYHLRILASMLAIGPWNRLPLTLRWFHEQYKIQMPFTPSRPSHIPEVAGQIKIVRNKSSMACFDQEITCHICATEVTQHAPVRCSNESCKTFFHKICLARKFLENEPKFLLPISGHCPVCSTPLLWGALIAACNENIIDSSDSDIDFE